MVQFRLGVFKGNLEIFESFYGGDKKMKIVKILYNLEGLVFLKAGNDLLFRVLRRSTIGAKGLYGRVRNGIACYPLAQITSL